MMAGGCRRCLCSVATLMIMSSLSQGFERSIDMDSTLDLVVVMPFPPSADAAYGEFRDLRVCVSFVEKGG